MHQFFAQVEPYGELLAFVVVLFLVIAGVVAIVTGAFNEKTGNGVQ